MVLGSSVATLHQGKHGIGESDATVNRQQADGRCVRLAIESVQVVGRSKEAGSAPSEDKDCLLTRHGHSREQQSCRAPGCRFRRFLRGAPVPRQFTGCPGTVPPGRGLKEPPDRSGIGRYPRRPAMSSPARRDSSCDRSQSVGTRSEEAIASTRIARSLGPASCSDPKRGSLASGAPMRASKRASEVRPSCS
jgi:hypothetical protein